MNEQKCFPLLLLLTDCELFPLGESKKKLIVHFGLYKCPLYFYRREPNTVYEK